MITNVVHRWIRAVHTKTGPPWIMVIVTPVTTRTNSPPISTTFATRCPGSNRPSCRANRPVNAPAGHRSHHRPSPRSARKVSRASAPSLRAATRTVRTMAPASPQPIQTWSRASGTPSTRASGLGFPSPPATSHHPVPRSGRVVR